MAHLVICLPSKHEDLSGNSQQPWNKFAPAGSTCGLHTREDVWKEGTLELVDQPASPAA